MGLNDVDTKGELSTAAEVFCGNVSAAAGNGHVAEQVLAATGQCGNH